MALFLVLIITEILSLIVLHQHFFRRSKAMYYASITVHIILSLWLWVLFFELLANNSFYDNLQHIWFMMNMKGMLCGVVFPRVILILFHFSGALIKRKSGGYLQWLTNTGLVLMVAIFSVIAMGTLYGRFNLTTEEVTIKIKGLNKDL